MRFKILIVLLFILFFEKGNSQNSEYNFSNGKYQEINTNYNHQIGSQTINNDLLYKINSGGFLTSELKQQNLDRLLDKNIFGISYSIQSEYLHIKKSVFGYKNFGFSVGLDYDAISEAQFSKDFYTLVLFGNKSFENSTALFKDNGFHNTEFATLKIGLRKLTDNSKHLFGIDFGLVSALRYGKLEMENFSLSFSSDFEYLSAAGNLNIEIDDTSHFGTYQPKAYGASLGLNYRYQNDDITKIQLQIRNAGILWHDNSSFQFTREIDYDSAIIETPNLLNMNNPYSNTSIQDSLTKSLFIHSKSGKFHSFLPIEMNFLWEQKINEHWKSIFVFKHRFFSYYKPYFFTQLKYQIHKNLSFGPSISYGGYSSLSGGFYVDARLFKNISFRIGSEYLTNVIFTSNTSAGIGGFATFTYKF